MLLGANEDELKRGSLSPSES